MIGPCIFLILTVRTEFAKTLSYFRTQAAYVHVPTYPAILTSTRKTLPLNIMGSNRLRNGQCAAVASAPGASRPSVVMDSFRRLLSSHSPVFRDVLRWVEESGKIRLP